MAILSLDARRTIEALRSGVPSDAAVRTLGAIQQEIEERFRDALRKTDAGTGARPLVVDANFGDGKSHLLHHLRVLAESEGFATSTVVVGPDAPIGDAHVVLKAIAEQARVPGHTGKALPELAAIATRESLSELGRWANEAPIHDRFRAMLRVYEATHDDELRVQILEDVEGKPILKTRLASELRALNEVSQYDLKSPRNAALAPDRIRIFAQFCRAHGQRGLVVFFDELERIVNFSFKARLAAYQQLGWWRAICETDGVPIFVVFAQTSGSIEQCLVDKGDEARLQASSFREERDELALKGIELLRSPIRLERATNTDLEELQHGVRDIYSQAYGGTPAPISQRPAWTTIRSEIRRWITEWDLARHYPGYRANIESRAISEDVTEIPDDLMPDEEVGS